MKTEQPTLIISHPTGTWEDSGLPAPSPFLPKNRIVTLYDTCRLANDGNTGPFGCVNADSPFSSFASVAVSGVVLVLSSTAITSYGPLTCDDNGKVRRAGSPLPPVNELVGYNLDLATGADQFVRILLK